MSGARATHRCMPDRCPDKLRQVLTNAVDGLCALCWKRKRLQAHRLVPRREGGQYVAENVVLLCCDCHDMVDSQDGLRRPLMSIREGLEWAVAQNRELRYPLAVRALRERWDCRLVVHSKDPLLCNIRDLFIGIREKEREHVRDVLKWLDEMVTWRKLCRRAITLIKQRPLADSLALLERNLRSNSEDPRYAELLTCLQGISSVTQLSEFYQNEVYRLEDYLIIHRNAERPIGLLWFHYYFKYRCAFISYLILPRPSRKGRGRPYHLRSLEHLVMRGLFNSLEVHHPECEGILMEIDPGEGNRLEAASADLSFRLGRISQKRGQGLSRLIRSRFEGIRRLDAPYLQPKSLVHGEREEMPLWLLYFPLNKEQPNQDAEGSERPWLSKSEYSMILEFIYQGIYRDELDNLEGFDKDVFSNYCAYLRELKQRVLDLTPARIRLL